MYFEKENSRSCSAKLLFSQVPEDLKMILFYRRPPVGKPVRITAVGDVGLSGQVGQAAKQVGVEAIFHEVAAVLKYGDVVFGNFENVLAAGLPPAGLFAASAELAPFLAEAGFNLLHLANNHIYDYGQEGLRTTLAIWQQCGVVPLGAGEDRGAAEKLVRTDRNGISIGWLGCGRTLQPQADNGPQFWEFDEEDLTQAIQQARKAVKVLIVSIHLGFAYLDYPHPDHKAMAERLTKAGADLVLMHHAHVLQGVQISEPGRGVCYNLGNFLWDWEEGNVKPEVMIEEQNEGAIFVFEIDREGICFAAAVPTYLDRNKCLKLARAEKGEKIITRLLKISRDLEHDQQDLFWQQYSERNTGLTIKVLRFHLCRGNFSYVWDNLKKVRGKHIIILLGWALNKIRKRLAVTLL